MNKTISNTDKLLNQFLEYSKKLTTEFEIYKVLKSRTYKIGESNVLVRAASEGNRNYFFGINYLTIEEIANLDNPVIAFICGSINRTLLLPAQILFKELKNISHDRNGEYKINIDKDLNLVLKGRGNRLRCSEYINNWELMNNPIQGAEKKSTIEESFHSVLQGRLIEIGNFRGYYTYSPDKSKRFNEKPLSKIITLKNCPKLQFSDYDLLRKIDVLWFKGTGSNLVPEKAFEIELSTGTWSGIGRMSTLSDYSNVSFYVVSNDVKRYNKVIKTFPVFADRFTHIKTDLLGELYNAEKNIRQLRIDIRL
ncbi:hypothetical protein BMS3Abin03_02360 [bacterium BMS3Abin03]|nr:hypothetical protein BMS3Abin03_02360 [bacterium BMS3Abin03]